MCGSTGQLAAEDEHRALALSRKAKFNGHACGIFTPNDPLDNLRSAADVDELAGHGRLRVSPRNRSRAFFLPPAYADTFVNSSSRSLRGTCTPLSITRLVFY
jgi:hypothetical protein